MTVCEMCGRSGALSNSLVEGVELKVCGNCAKYGKAAALRTVPRNGYKRSFQRKEEPAFRIVRGCANVLRSAREKQGLSQKEFASSIGERESVVAKWESGSMKPRVGVARRLEKRFGVVLVESDENKNVNVSADSAKKKSDVFTLGDFIKVRKRK